MVIGWGGGCYGVVPLVGWLCLILWLLLEMRFSGHDCVRIFPKMNLLETKYGAM